MKREREAKRRGARLELRRIRSAARVNGERGKKVYKKTFFEAKTVTSGGTTTFVARLAPNLTTVAGAILARPDGVLVNGIPKKTEWLSVTAPNAKSFKAYFCDYLQKVEAQSIGYECWLTDESAPCHFNRNLKIDSGTVEQRLDDALSLMQVVHTCTNDAWAEK